MGIIILYSLNIILSALAFARRVYYTPTSTCICYLDSCIEWVIVVKSQFSNFSAISWQEQNTFWRYDDEVHFVLDKHA